MNKEEFLSALDRALGGLPPEERQNAMQYYEDYLEDAGEGHEAEAIAGLGSPEAVAQAILNDYRDLAPHGGGASGASGAPQEPRPIKRGISPWLLLVIVLLAIPVGVPLAAGLGGALIGVLAAVFAVLVCLFLIPLILCIVGMAVLFAGCGALFTAPASAVLAIGGALVCLSLGVLSALLLIKLCMLFIPPVVRGVVSLCRKPFEKRRGRP
ncbi:DUF1700 domain-containing protein [Intestinibacillus massiliensis]|uniref:DUF1700 domain-containing protein n=1 Tax=Intestinibacillus massiliensis TaxID=1871029 RepID=UPI0013564AF6|nr:DUF1700 domain-containing protein [Intestinibacillus massiliensis]MCB6366140.1 DUF1700 domain-containing protein [Intestinibacillus massiliensis]